MTDKRLREKQLFLQAIDLTDDQKRTSFLDQACSGHPTLRLRLDRLLANSTKADTFFSASPKLKDVSLESEIPFQIDRYRLLQRIGQGTCGVVYLAEQLEPVRRKVAVKIIRLGMDTENVISRFSLERQALALMDHPNIARVYDAGATPTGRPYFVMEYVEGIPITEYCDQHRLDLPTRLDLFVKICDAVAHAHQRGIVHRDIKPANILVSAENNIPTPKLIDFGVAKAIDERVGERPHATAISQIIGTPCYMSPEQVLGDGSQIDTRSDIYSLGALLYELLTGQPPFQTEQLTQDGLPGLIRALKETEPPRPSALLSSLPQQEQEQRSRLRTTQPGRLLRTLRQDLDWVVMKAIEKQRTRRYETAHSLATEITHLRQNQPVTARPPSRLYRLGKLVRRNRAVFLAGTSVSLALLLGTVISTSLYLREREALRTQVILRQEAEQARANETRLRQRAEAVNTMAEAAVLVSHNQLDQADNLVSSIPPEQVPPSLENAGVFRTLAQWHALAGNWTMAETRFLTLAHIITHTDSADSDAVSRDMLNISAALCRVNVPGHYDTFRQLALARFADSTNPIVAEHLLKTCLLRPAPHTMLESLRPLAAVIESSLQSPGNTNTYMAAWRCLALSLYDYRTGDDAAARHWGEQCAFSPDHHDARKAAALAILGLVALRENQPDQAQTVLNESRQILTTKVPSPLVNGSSSEGFWFDWIHASLLLEEANSASE